MFSYSLGKQIALNSLGIKLAVNTSDNHENDGLRLIGAAGLTGIGLGQITPGMEETLGYKNIYHGTSHNAAKNIDVEGLKARHGGAAHGSSAGVNNENFIRNSKGKVHVGSGPLGAMGAKSHARLTEAMAQAAAQGRKLSPDEAMRIFMFGEQQGKVYKGKIPYQDFIKDFEVDPDFKGVGFRTTKDIPREVFENDMFDFGPMRRATRNFGSYVKNHPGLFARGVGRLAVVPASLGAAYSLAKPVFVDSDT